MSGVLVSALCSLLRHADTIVVSEVVLCLDRLPPNFLRDWDALPNSQSSSSVATTDPRPDSNKLMPKWKPW